MLQETLEYFANPDNLNSDVLPPGLASWDPTAYLASAIPIAVSVVGVNFVHEIGHRIAAFIRKVKLGPTYFVPNLQVSVLTGCNHVPCALFANDALSIKQPNNQFLINQSSRIKIPGLLVALIASLGLQHLPDGERFQWAFNGGGSASLHFFVGGAGWTS